MKSMTGFGRGEAERNGYRMTVEIKTVNHRYFEPTIRMNRKLGPLEAEARRVLKDTISRGKTDMFVTYENLSEEQGHVKVNGPLLKSYVTALREAGASMGLMDSLSVSDILRFPEVITTEAAPEDMELLWSVLEEAIRKALLNLDAMREKEGSHLQSDLLDKIRNLEVCRQDLMEKAPSVVDYYKEKLRMRLSELIERGNLDPGRLEAEATLFADKCCIDEELTRLASHFAQFRQTLELEEPIGRKLDFLTQELNRETNTIASKANALEISKIALRMKNEIEKIREQIQNVE